MASSSNAKPKLAVVEDNPDNLLLMRALLEHDFDLTTYRSGSQALQGMVKQLPDLAVVDISLPEMDGTELLARIRQEPSLAGIPVVAVTAHAMEGDREEYLRKGFNGYLAKPIVDEMVLIQTLKSLLAHSARSQSTP